MLFQLCHLAVALLLPVAIVAIPAASNSELPAHLRGKRSFVERDGVNRTVFEHEASGATIDFVTNSGICETTPGVNQYSGYVTLNSNENMWFWFFESRESPTTAPLTMWLNGGPGCSSMIGLFQENGPCQFYNGASTPSLNPYSFNSYANMLYVDQPVGTGFSYGTDPVTSTVTAAPLVWALLQAFFAQFPQYESRDFGLFTESYGGHYGPEFASYFQSQNTKIAAGTVTGETVSLVALGINNGWYDAAIQYQAYVDYSYNNTYKQLITKSQQTALQKKMTNDCLPDIQACSGITGTNSACETASSTCGDDIENAIIDDADFDVYDVRAGSNDAFPPETYATYLTQASVVKAIGAQATYSECPDAPYEKFADTGDDSRSFLATLETVVASGIHILIWAGDADWICNWYGGLKVANSVGSTAFAALGVQPYTVNGTSYGNFKTSGNLSWLQVFEAGHEVPAYQPIVALQAFIQTMKKTPLKST